MLTVANVEKNKIGEELGFEKGDNIVAFNGHDASDILDYIYYNSLTEFNVTVLTNDGKTVDIQIEKDVEESLGLSFLDDNLKIKTCQNNCVFCFVEQMPKGLRDSLYVKDDDYRQSFINGNYVTLTNVSKKDIERIIRLNLSPLYVSVHATQSEVRKKMLNNRFAGDILDKLTVLTEAGIKIDAQIVLVRGLNDGAILEDTLKSLYKLKPNLKCVSVVPCGITKYREGLYPIKDIDTGYATCVIEQVKTFNLSVKENFALLADEFYFKGQLPVEKQEFYGDFSEVGNGVGTTAKFLGEIENALKKKKSSGSYLLITGESAGDFINEVVGKVLNHVSGITVEVLKVKNNFFGQTVNCTGLLTGIDVLNAILSKNKQYDYVVLPDICLKCDEDVFLDGMTVEELRLKINMQIIITDGSGQSFFDALSKGKKVRKVK